MEYLVINPQYRLRYGEVCTYIIKKNQLIDPQIRPSEGVISFVPTSIGFILSEIGRQPYLKSLTYIGEHLGTTPGHIHRLMAQLIENNQMLRLPLDSSLRPIIFPKRLLIRSSRPSEVSSLPFTGAIDINTSLDLFNQSSLRPNIPFNLNIMVTNKCTTNCIYCYANRHLEEKLSTKDLMSIVSQSEETGVVNLTLTGGDLLARADSIDIIKTCIKAGYPPFVSTKTPKSRTFVEKLKDAGLSRLQFSIDSARSVTLSKLINSDKEYLSRTKEFFKACNENQIKLSLRTVITNMNASKDETITLIDFIRQFENISDWTISPAFLSPYKKNSCNLTPTDEMLAGVYKISRSQSLDFPVYYNKMDQNGYSQIKYDSKASFLRDHFSCIAGSASMSILSDGNCTICEMLYNNPSFRIGNILKETLIQVWNSQKALDIYSGTPNKMSASSCAQCTLKECCKGGFFKHICYVDVAKIYGEENASDYPDPHCPTSPKYKPTIL